MQPQKERDYLEKLKLSEIERSGLHFNQKRLAGWNF